jgi:hypothetical protein
MAVCVIRYGAGWMVEEGVLYCCCGTVSESGLHTLRQPARLARLSIKLKDDYKQDQHRADPAGHLSGQ